MSSRLLACALVLLAAAVLPARANADDRARLDKGEILTARRAVPGSAIPETVTRAVVEAPVPRVWRIVDDCGNYKRTLPRIADSRQLERSGGKVVCELTVDVPFPFDDLVSVSEAQHVVGPPRWTRTWRLLRGDYKHYAGSWTLEAFDPEGKRTLVTYRLHAEPKTALPDALLRQAVTRNLPALIERLRKESR